MHILGLGFEIFKVYFSRLTCSPSKATTLRRKCQVI